MSTNFYEKTVEDLQEDLDDVLAEREHLKNIRDEAIINLREKGARMPSLEWDKLNKRIQECNKIAAAIRKQIQRKYKEERHYTRVDDKRGRNGHFGY